MVGGCSNIPIIGSLFAGDDDSNDVDVEAIDTTEQKVYAQAQRGLRSSNYALAIEQLELLEARFPFGRFAEQAQLELIYARHMTSDFDGARGGADRFIRLHPNHPNVDYAFYLRALSAYQIRQGIFDRLFSAELGSRDMAPVLESFRDFSLLLNTFPESQYSTDARQRMIFLRDTLAQHELFVADYYLRRGGLVAASNRARYIIENYPASKYRADAMAVLIEASWKLGLTEQANNALRVLALNHPDYSAFDEDGNLVLKERIRDRDRSWTNIMTLGLLDRPEVPPPLTIVQPSEDAPDATRTSNPGAPSQDSTSKKKRGWFNWLPFVG